MIFNWLSLITGMFYIILGIVVIIYKFFIIYLEPLIAYSLGALLILYGLFRIGRAIYRLRQDRNEV
ncbi:C4-dicarboxylate ABC transporter [Kaistella pullorum]|uniref:C4-dicarboxylate ABC transporter n=1 Tax=Kaistella pullorum TaxID=2763074 RepID=A0ABR8WKW1_9FLAO|nr:C4-dicarboxylate ABC transporter [Kaistella pullorum]MBD8017702.1 C4-dicarboxylate ABC transporter [Kaistella pullorum]